MKFTAFASAVVALDGLAAATPSRYRPHPFEQALQKRNSCSQQSNGSSTTVDLGYEVYEGALNPATNINEYLGIRFAAPPLGALRWQAPQPPTYNRSQTIMAHAFAPQCPQSAFGNPGYPGLNGTLGDEDCLFLNVYAPKGAKDLPVLVWIHGGGYGLGNGQQNLSSIIKTNDDGFVGVAIQYRLGAFGFLSSDEVFRNGVVNAGILDQHFALQWVQAYIGQFGGNASQVTISGESAGGGAVMLQDMAYGGTLGTSLFRNSFASSPYLPMQYGYKDWVPSQSYYAFATHAGCPPDWAYGNSSQTVFGCLLSQNTTTLQLASLAVSSSGTYGSWAFLPVTDGVFIQQTPSQQLLQKRVNGEHMLVGNNANEGPLFTTPNITTEADLVSWLHLIFPLFDNEDISKVLLYYPSTNDSVNPMAVDFATLGYTGPTALNVSSIATGPQQRADNIYAETTFICPSYWMAEAYSSAAGTGLASWKYQYSVPPALHGADVALWFMAPSGVIGADISTAAMTMVGNFVRYNDPAISQAVALGSSSNSGVAAASANAAANWPSFSVQAPYQLNLNQTGGTVTSVPLGLPGIPGNGTVYLGPGLMNNFSLVNAYTWEGGRGMRCDFWRAVSGRVPE